jgi:hypothetical protein
MIAGQQKDRVVELLKSIKDDVTTEDRKVAEVKCKMHQSTITKYLVKLDVSNEDLGLRLYRCLKKRIDDRSNSILKELNN